MIQYRNKQLGYLYLFCLYYVFFLLHMFNQVEKQQKISIFENKYNLVRNWIYILIAL